MQPTSREQELLALQSISETLNRSNETEEMLQAVLTQLLEVTGLPTGWIFLARQEPDFSFVSRVGLPPALSWGGDAPMCSGSCWCLERLWDGRLSRAVNILSCKRIENAEKYKWGDTQQISHHASIPLKAGDELIGVLNVAAPGKRHFDSEELALLQAVAYQIGSAVKRTMLFQAERRRATRMTRLSEVSGWIAETMETGVVSELIAERIGTAFEWAHTALFLREGNELYIRARYSAAEGRIASSRQKLRLLDAGPVSDAMSILNTVLMTHNKEKYEELEEVGVDLFQSAIAVPLYRSDIAYGVLLVTDERPGAFDELDVEVLEALGGQIALSIDKARLVLQRRELTRQEERHKLARDLHDSVSQTLFSLSVTARGAESLPDADQTLLREALQELQALSQHALQEMRSLIWQLRPPGLEQGLVTGLAQYGERLGLTVRTEVSGLGELPQLIEEALWRIGQEALNNASKHSGSPEAELTIAYGEDKVRLKVADRGAGFDRDGLHPNVSCKGGLGLNGMQERAALVGGFVHIASKPGQGTVVVAELPIADQFPPNLCMEKGGIQ